MDGYKAKAIQGLIRCLHASNTQKANRVDWLLLVAGEGFEPSKAEPGDLQSPPIGRSGNPPRLSMRPGKGTGAVH